AGVIHRIEQHCRKVTGVKTLHKRQSLFCPPAKQNNLPGNGLWIGNRLLPAAILPYALQRPVVILWLLFQYSLMAKQNELLHQPTRLLLFLSGTVWQLYSLT